MPNLPGNHGQRLSAGSMNVQGITAPAMVTSAPVDRFRSFAERYMIERAGQFRSTHVLEDGWQALQDAKKLYGMIAAASEEAYQQDRMRAQMQQIRDFEFEKTMVTMRQAHSSPPAQIIPPGVAAPTSNVSIGSRAHALIEQIKGYHLVGQKPPKPLVKEFYDEIKGEDPHVQKKAKPVASR